MAGRNPIFVEREHDEIPKRPAVPAFSFREPFWWAIVAIIALVGAFVFVLAVGQA